MSGPSSVSSLNSGCGWVLSIIGPLAFVVLILRDGASRLLWMRASCLSPSSRGAAKPRLDGWCLLYPRDRLCKIPRGESCEIVDALADPDEVYRQPVLFRQRHQDAAPRGTVELCHDKASDASRTVKCLDLGQRILSDRGVKHQQHRMRRCIVDLADDANDLFQLIHQFGLVLQTARGIDQEHVELSVP